METVQIKNALVSAAWVQLTFEVRARQDSVDVEVDKDTYIEGRLSHYHDMLTDSSFENDMYELAIEENQVISYIS